MTVSISTRNYVEGTTSWLVLEIAGRIDAFNDKRVMQAVDETISNGCRWICLDISGVEFMSFQAMQMVLQVSEAVRCRGGDLVLVGANAQVRRHLETFAGHRSLKVFRNYKELESGVFAIPRAEFAAAESFSAL